MFLSAISYYINIENLGLVNGTRATIRQIVFAPGADHKIDLPRFIMLEVDGYTGMSEIYTIKYYIY